jgi:hypothetical protein
MPDLSNSLTCPIIRTGRAMIVAEKPTLWNFGLAFLHGWATAMSGPLSVPLAIAALWVENNTARALLGVSAFLCVWVAAYGVWRNERIARNAAGIRADEEQRRADAIRAEFNEKRCILLVGLPMCIHDFGAERWTVTITNKGPAVAVGVQMRLINIDLPPKNAPWMRGQTHKVILSGMTFDAPHPRIPTGQSETFELFRIHPGNPVVPVTNMDTSHHRDITIENGEHWGLSYQAFAENSKAEEFLIVMRRQNNSVTIEDRNGRRY